VSLTCHETGRALRSPNPSVKSTEESVIQKRGPLHTVISSGVLRRICTKVGSRGLDTRADSDKQLRGNNSAILAEISGGANPVGNAVTVTYVSREVSGRILRIVLTLEQIFGMMDRQTGLVVQKSAYSMV
jgi:hypothetical protein